MFISEKERFAKNNKHFALSIKFQKEEKLKKYFIFKINFRENIRNARISKMKKNRRFLEKKYSKENNQHFGLSLKKSQDVFIRNTGHFI